MADYRDNPFRQGTVAGRATQTDIDQGLRAEVFRYEKDLSKAMLTEGKHERGAATSAVRDRILSDLTRGVAEEEVKNTTKNIKEFFGDLKKHCERVAILSVGQIVACGRHAPARHLSAGSRRQLKSVCVGRWV